MCQQQEKIKRTMTNKFTEEINNKYFDIKK